MTRPNDGGDGWLRLRFYLADLRVGDAITVDRATRETHLSSESVDLVLEALARAGLFERRGEYYVRCQVELPVADRFRSA